MRVTVQLIWKGTTISMAHCDSGKDHWAAHCEVTKRTHGHEPPLNTPLVCQIYGQAFFASGPDVYFSVSGMCSST